MTAKDAAFDLLKRQKDLPTGDPSVQKQHWLQTLDQLMDLLEAWLQAAESEGLLKIERDKWRVLEERLGVYIAPRLNVVTPRGDTVTITPRARYVVGAEGRVDMECPPKKAIFLHRGSQGWQIAKLAQMQAGWSYEPLTEESFWAHFKDLLL
ncbi:MAG TPA: hypothetical protein VND64_13775 [Pirellulales bacterium]|nr:hypothetical protein [Pirellulales bacterium]